MDVSVYPDTFFLCFVSYVRDDEQVISRPQTPNAELAVRIAGGSVELACIGLQPYRGERQYILALSIENTTAEIMG